MVKDPRDRSYEAWPEVTPEEAHRASLILAETSLRLHDDPNAAACGLREVLEALSLKETPTDD